MAPFLTQASVRLAVRVRRTFLYQAGRAEFVGQLRLARLRNVIQAGRTAYSDRDTRRSRSPAGSPPERARNADTALSLADVTFPSGNRAGH